MVDLQQIIDMGAYGLLENIFRHLNPLMHARKTGYEEDWKTILSCYETCREFRHYARRMFTAEDVNWKHISRNVRLTEDFVRDFQDNLDWYEVSARSNQFSETFLWEYRNKYDWDVFLQFNTVTWNFLEELLREKVLKDSTISRFRSYLSPLELVCEQDSSTRKKMVDLQQIIDMGAYGLLANIFRHLEPQMYASKTGNKEDWTTIISCYETCREFRYYARRMLTREDVNWRHISRNERLTEDFMRGFQDNVDWYEISAQSNQFSEKFLWEFRNKYDWDSFLQFNTVPCSLLRTLIREKLLKDCSTRRFWKYVSECASLSEDFIKEFASELDWPTMCECQELSENLMDEHFDKLDWYFVSNSQFLSEKFIEKYGNNLDCSEFKLNPYTSHTLSGNYAL